VKLLAVSCHTPAADARADSHMVRARARGGAGLPTNAVRGEVLDDEEVYNVDFMRKGFLEEAPPPPPPPSSSGDGPAHPYGNLDGGMMSEDMQRERERQSWEAGVTAAHHAELEEEQRRQERKEAILDINKETRDERDRTHSLRHRRAAQVSRMPIPSSSSGTPRRREASHGRASMNVFAHLLTSNHIARRAFVPFVLPPDGCTRRNGVGAES
jgi:hypothetical protein